MAVITQDLLTHLKEIHDLKEKLNALEFRSTSSVATSFSVTQGDKMDLKYAEEKKMPDIFCLQIKNTSDAKACLDELDKLCAVLKDSDNLENTKRQRNDITSLENACSRLSQQETKRESIAYVEDRLQSIQENEEQKWEDTCREKRGHLQQLERKVKEVKASLLQRKKQCERLDEMKAALSQRKNEQQYIKKKLHEVMGQLEDLRSSSLHDDEQELVSEIKKIKHRRAALIRLNENASSPIVEKSCPLSQEHSKISQQVKKILEYGNSSGLPSMMLLSLLSRNSGKMTMSELKMEMTRLLSPKAVNVARHIYSLVASELIEIDRSSTDPTVKLREGLK